MSRTKQLHATVSACLQCLHAYSVWRETNDDFKGTMSSMMGVISDENDKNGLRKRRQF